MSGPQRNPTPPAKEYTEYMEAGYQFAQLERMFEIHPSNAKVASRHEVSALRLLEAAVRLFGIKKP